MRSAIRIELESGITDRRLEKWAKEARTYLGVPLEALEEVRIYKLQPRHAPHGEELIGRLRDVFADPVLQTLHAEDKKYSFNDRKPSFIAEISFRPGVTDNPARSAAEALSLVGIDAEVASGSLYFLFGDVGEKGAEKVARELLSNALIQKSEVWTSDAFYKTDRFGSATLPKVTLTAAPQITEVSLDLDDAGLEVLSKDRCLALTAAEMKHIRDYYGRPDVQVARKAKKLPLQPTDVEIEILAQSWSEHCKHKIFSAKIDYKDASGKKQIVDSLYRTYIKGATREIAEARKLDWLVSVFSDNAGIVRFDPKIDLCIKVETHNSPSALDPYGGALTGILGVNRDILGCGMGARPIANTDVFCFAPPDMPKAGEEKYMPDGPKPPRRVLEGVHRGVEDGGNKSGIPTVNGAFFFDRDYAGKPLVFVGTVGAMPQTLPDGRPSSTKKLSPGDRIMMVGGAIGADGVHGATFSSLELNDNAPATAVQIGDPLTQKRVMDFLLEARDLGLYAALTDNGAGGLSSSVGEMATMSGGASLDLALCPVKYPGLSPWELMVSESQERMTFAVPPSHSAAFLALAGKRGVSATDIGAFDDSGKLTVFYGKKLAAELELAFLHDSLPQMELTAEWTGAKPRPAWSPTTALSGKKEHVPADIESILVKLLSSPNITSKEKWVRAYDHEVQAATHQKPFIGEYSDGPSDAGVIWLHPHGGGKDNGIAIGCGLAPRISPIDPYLMAQFAVDEAIRNVVASGGDPDICCLLDNFCWPDPVASARNPDGVYKLGQLVRACRGLYDICKDYGTPLVSGKDSMKNDFRGKDKRGQEISISVLPTLLITAMARVPMGATAGSDFKDAGDLIYLLGEKGSQGLSGSEFSCHYETISAVPSIDPRKNMLLYRKLHSILKQNLVRSVHDISEGGLLIALAESMIGGRRGAELFMNSGDKDFADACFNEAPGRFVVSVAAAQQAAFEQALSGCDFLRIGHVTEEDQLSLAGSPSIPLKNLAQAWQKGF
ncbi:MAG: AIR synthase-related protein [Pseudomonadota bacterium]